VGVDLVVIIGHTLDATGVFALPTRLRRSLPVRAVASESAPFKPTWEQPSHRDGPAVVSAASVRDAWAKHRPPTLYGVAGIHWRVGARVLIGHHYLRFGGFVDERFGNQRPVRRLCRAIAAELGSERAIYVPDSSSRLENGGNLGETGSSFEEVEAWLRAIEPPSPTIGAIYRHTGSGYEVNGYFIDDFADLDEPAPTYPIRQRAWNVHEVAQVTSTMARLVGEIDALEHERLEVQELATWLAALGRHERAALTALLNKHGSSPVPEHFRALVAILGGPEAEHVAALRALTDHVALLADFLDTLTPAERRSDSAEEPYAAAIRVLGELDSDDAARALVTSFPRWGDHYSALRAAAAQALRRCGPRILEPALEAWDQIHGEDREALVRALLDARLRDERLRDKLQAWLASGRYPYDELKAIAEYGDDALVPHVHAVIDHHLATYPGSGVLRVVEAATGALHALGATLGDAQKSRLAAIIADHEQGSAVGDQMALETARSILARVAPGDDDCRAQT
jgi:hypothetical protein